MRDTVVDTKVIRDAVRLACRAPSLHNSQPWRWVAEGHVVQLFVDPDRAPVHTDESGREALIGCGAVLDHFRVAMAAAGWTANVDRFPNPNNLHHLASIDFSPMEFVTDGHRRRADAILQRRTDRLPFAAPANWESFEKELRDSVDVGDVRLDAVPDELRPELAEASQLTESLRLYDSSYHAELTGWTTDFNVTDGIPQSSLISAAESDRVDVGRNFPVTHNPERRSEVSDDHSKIVVLSTYDDTHDSMLRCGEMLSAVLLERHDGRAGHMHTHPHHRGARESPDPFHSDRTDCDAAGPCSGRLGADHQRRRPTDAAATDRRRVRSQIHEYMNASNANVGANMGERRSSPSVVVGIDGSQSAVDAALWAVDEAVSRDIPLRLVYAIDPEATTGTDNQAAARDLATAEIAVRHAFMAVESTDKPVKIEVEILQGRPVRALKEASRWAAMLCVGSLGLAHSTRGHSRIGSTAAALATSTHCPVAIVHGHKPLPATQGWVVAEVNASPTSDGALRRAFEQAQLRQAPLRVLTTWQSRYTDIHDNNAVADGNRLSKTTAQPPTDRMEVALPRSRRSSGGRPRQHSELPRQTCTLDSASRRSA